MNFKNIFIILIGIVVIVIACNTYEDTVCTKCTEQKVKFTTNMCGTEGNVAGFEYNLAMSGDSIKYYDTVRYSDSVTFSFEYLIDSTTYEQYYTLVKGDSLYNDLKDSTLLFVYYDESSETWQTFNSEYYIVYKSGADTIYDIDSNLFVNDSILYVYSDSIVIDSSKIYSLKYQAVNFEYQEPYISMDGDTTYSLLSTDTINKFWITTVFDTLDMDEEVHYDTSTYRRYFQQKWKCIRQ